VTDSHREFQLSVLEADILVAIDHVGWYAYLWFPIVQREVLNFGSENFDEEVHAAFASLIRKGALISIQKHPAEAPDWSAAPKALEIARDTLALGRDLRQDRQ
jgi:hypothetical protein